MSDLIRWDEIELVPYSQNGVSGYSPKYDIDWSDRDKIAYELAYTYKTFGLRAMAYDQNSHKNGRPTPKKSYGVICGNSSVSCGELEETLRSIVDMGIGYQAALTTKETNGTPE